MTASSYLFIYLAKEKALSVFHQLGEIILPNIWRASEGNLACCVPVLMLSVIRHIKGGLHLKPLKFEHIFVAVITFFTLYSVQKLLKPVCCLLCVL